MKIAIPLDENKTDVCMVLARAPFFLFWEDGQQTIAENPAAQAQGGMVSRQRSFWWTAQRTC